MYDFEDSGTESGMFDVEFCSIDDVVNIICVYKGMEDLLTSNGQRKLIAVDTPDEVATAFLTSSKTVIRQVDGQIEKKRVPFRAIMKCVPYGGAFIGFRLFPPSAGVTEEDQKLFLKYKKTKFKR